MNPSTFSGPVVRGYQGNFTNSPSVFLKSPTFCLHICWKMFLIVLHMLKELGEKPRSCVSGRVKLTMIYYTVVCTCTWDECTLPTDEEEWRPQGKVRRGVVEEGAELVRRPSQGETTLANHILIITFHGCWELVQPSPAPLETITTIWWWTAEPGCLYRRWWGWWSAGVCNWPGGGVRGDLGQAGTPRLRDRVGDNHTGTRTARE